MRSTSRGRSTTLAALIGWLALAGATSGRAGDIYFHRTVGELTIVEGRLPADSDAPEAAPGVRRPAEARIRAATEPYVVIDGAGEVYLGRTLDPQAGAGWNPPLERLQKDDVLAFALAERREVSGRLFAPRPDGSGMATITFKVSPPAGQADAKPVFALAKKRHYERLLARALPGATWFALQARAAEALSSAAPAGQPAANAGPRSETDLERTFALFSGGRAIDENLQLDRPLPQRAPGASPDARKPIKTEGLAGITVAEIDWSARLKGKSPQLDPLAANIPADQHAVFLPGLKEAAALLAGFRGDAIPVIGLALPRSEDNQVQRRYERQLGVALADVARSSVAGSVRSLAATGSDPYLPSGTDVAILVETSSPAALAGFLKARIDDTRRARPDAVDADGRVGDVAFQGAQTPDRRLSAYLATLGQAVVLANSRAQLERVIAATQGKIPPLAGQPEYRFFRDRYPRAEADESALLVLTDAAIRRWCGPRWRIGSSRRMRAAAALAELQAANLKAIVEQAATNEPLTAPAGSIGLGTLRLGPAGPWSETYGTLDFQTPILEIPLDEVEAAEADAYGRWRDTYQQNWRGVFDPIAVRLSIRPTRLAADLTVMPLIAGTDYRRFLDLVGGARISADSGDRHPGTLLHAAMALDRKSTLFTEGGDQVAVMTRVPREVALGWLGSSVSLYLDDDPFWKELAAAERPESFLGERINTLPVGVHVEVTDGVKLALFLAGLRTFVDQAGPNLTTWENREHKGLRYVKVAEAENARPAAAGPKFALYYVTTPRSLTLSLNEGVIRRAIERQAEKAGPGAQPKPWLGHSLALQASTRGLEVLGRAGAPAYRDEVRLRSWDNLPILNEWKRLFPGRDPVAVHEAAWGTRLVDPAGGRYAWNERAGTMESTIFGHPGEPRPGQGVIDPLARITSAALGLSFEDGGLRARVDLDLRQEPRFAAEGARRGD